MHQKLHFRLPCLQGQQEYFKNGKTSWDDKIYGQIDKIENREKFSYDVDNDQLFQQALASAMKSGHTAMQDTIGQASALTGGYGSTYATSVGNQAYNAFIEDAYNNLPEYYQMALQTYQAEGEEMYNLLGLYTQMGEQEWNRNVDAYNTVFDFATSQRDFEYGMYQDDITNTYNAMNMYDSFYQQENAQNMALWQQEIDNAWNIIGQQSTEYWNQKNFDENKRQFDMEFSANYTSDGNGGYVKKGNAGSGDPEYKTPTQPQKEGALEAYNNGGTAALEKYLASLPDDVDIDSVAQYAIDFGEDYAQYYDYTISNDTENGGFLWFKGKDHDDEYSLYDKDGNIVGDSTLSYDDLEEKIKSSNMPKDQKNALLKTLKKQSTK